MDLLCLRPIIWKGRGIMTSFINKRTTRRGLLQTFLPFLLGFCWFGAFAQPGAPTLVFPKIGVVLEDTAFALDWNPVNQAVSYELQVATDSNFSNMVTNPVILKGQIMRVIKLMMFPEIFIS